MAKVWLARRIGERWGAVDREPAYEAPLGQLIFKLDLGWQRRQPSGPTMPTPGRTPGAATKVFVEVLPADLEDILFRAYQVGWYDSPYSPAETARRLGPPRRAAA